jgi:hypothetical protein
MSPRLRGGKLFRKTGFHPRLREGMLFRDMRYRTWIFTSFDGGR